MSEPRPWTVVRALEQYERLRSMLARLKGGPLDPSRPEDRTTGLGYLAEKLAAIAAHPIADVESFWDGQITRGDLEATRLTAIVFHRWALGAERDEDLRAADLWYRRALDHWRHLVEGLPIWREHSFVGRKSPELWEATASVVVPWLLTLHRDRALAALDRGDMATADLHWAILADSPEPEVEEMRRELVRCVVAASHHLDATGLARGVEHGAEAALAILVAARDHEPASMPLHRQIVSLAVRVALTYHAMDHLDRFADVVSTMRRSLVWLREHHEVVRDDLAFREIVADGWVCMAATETNPGDAVRFLRAALGLNQHHPTASSLLGRALAALAARHLGAGRHTAALLAIDEASHLLGNDDPAVVRLREAAEET